MQPSDEKAQIERAAEELAQGRLVVFPTETFYGLAADPRSEVAIAALRGDKDRPLGKALPLVAGTREQVGLVAPGWERDRLAARLAAAFWPGPLSLVLEAGADLAPGVAGADGSVAIRVTSHPLAAELCCAFGYPLIATSANRSGEPPATRGQDALAGLAGAARPPFLLEGGETPGGAPSTIVDTRTGQLRILREGALSASELAVVSDDG